MRRLISAAVLAGAITACGDADNNLGCPLG